MAVAQWQRKLQRGFTVPFAWVPWQSTGDAGKIGEEVVQRLEALLGSDVEVTLEITARTPEGFPDKVLRTVTENARTLKFETFGSEEE